MDVFLKSLSIKVHEPFAAFLKASAQETSFEITLLDCYRFAGHACHSITGAFLVTREAVNQLFPETHTCERGALEVSFGSELHEKATGPRSNVVSFITGAWGETGFPGLKGQFSRKNLVSYGNKDLALNEVLFLRASTGKSVVIKYDPSTVTSLLDHQLEFPDSWRFEINEILKKKDQVIQIKK